MLVALLLVAQVVEVDTLATCRIANDPAARVWTLERREDPSDPTRGRWSIAFRSRTLDKPRVELPIPNPTFIANGVRFLYQSANGGLTVEWNMIDGVSTLELLVNHGLEVNVQPDLDPAVDLLNTDGRVTCAQEQVRARNHSEWVVAIGAARSVKLFQSTAGRSYAVQTIGWGRELTGDWAPGSLRGRFTWAVEAMPVFAQFSPATIYGFGFAPVVWRWNFTPRPRYSVFAELSMGGMWTTAPIPERTSRGNFTAHWGGGVRLRPRGGNAMVLAYRFQHFSNGNQLGSNPGVNSHVVLIGWSHRS